MSELDGLIRVELNSAQRTVYAYSDWVSAGDYDDASEAIRAVLELHKPEMTRHRRARDRHLVCIECVYEESSSRVVYPCDTVRVIAATLGVLRER